MALAKKSTGVTEPTVESDAATDPLPSDPESSSELPGPQLDDGPLVSVDAGPGSGDGTDVGGMLAGGEGGSGGNYKPGIVNLNAPDPSTILDTPAPIQNDRTDMADLPPRPMNLPDGGNCHIIWPGDALTVSAVKAPNGAVVTTCRHYEAHLAAGSKTRWTFRLLYAAGVEIHDRRVMQRLMVNQLSVPAGV